MNNSFNMKYVWTISLVAAMGGLLFGYDWVVIGGAKPFFERYFQLTTNEFASGWANSCALIGCLFGALMAGALSDRFGRKKLLILCALLFTVTSIGNGLAPTFTVFVCLANLRRRGHRPGVESLADVYRRSRAGPNTRATGLGQPTHHRHRHPIGAIGEQFPCIRHAKGDKRRAFGAIMVCANRLALDVRPDRRFLRCYSSSACSPCRKAPVGWSKTATPDRAQSVLAKIGGHEYAAAALADINSTLADEYPESKLPRPARAADEKGLGDWNYPGGFPTVVRDQRDLQLRR